MPVTTTDGAQPFNPTNNHGKTITRVVVAQGAAGATTLASASAGKKHKVVGVLLTLDAAGTLKFSDSTPVDLTGVMSIGTAGGFVVPPNPECPWIESAVNTDLTITSVTGKAAGVVLIVTEA